MCNCYALEIYRLTGYELWASENSLTGDASDDEDGDGMSNLAEYLFGRDPAAAGDVETNGAGCEWLGHTHCCTIKKRYRCSSKLLISGNG